MAIRRFERASYILCKFLVKTVTGFDRHASNLAGNMLGF
jgi:hypothetical protein